MLDIRLIRRDHERYKDLLGRKGDYPIDELLALDVDRRKQLALLEELKARQNAASKQIPVMKKEGKDTGPIMEEMKEAASQSKAIDNSLSVIDNNIATILSGFPNLPHENVPIGSDESENVEVLKYGEPRQFDFEVKAHWDLGVDLGILDFERASKIAGARFSMWTGLGAKLERALINFMLALHTDTGKYMEIIPPFMVNRSSLFNTGQLPKFEEDAFNIKNNDYFMIPTAEVPLTNFHSGEIIPDGSLPICYTAYSPCFRAEAGSAGRDTRGLIRNHQFDKVELVKLSEQETSYEELEDMLLSAQQVLKDLELPYRIIELCTGDLGFSAAKTYDIEVWMPSYNRYVEISSCSNCEDFQSRRANIRYRDKEGKLSFVHTLNGSALAVGRTFAALLENWQDENGNVAIPEKLRPFFGGIELITPQQ
ncbi:MAG: serine--tRNA ligase [Eubacteriaceae bacterium]|nr:serine--tRNA ligase [Eubacteriaceae bacterium]